MKLIMEEWRRFEEREVLLANESYVRNVLGVEIPLNESYPYSHQLQDHILQEQLLFEGFFDDIQQLPEQAKDIFTALSRVWKDPNQVDSYYKEVDEEADADIAPALSFFQTIRDKLSALLKFVSRQAGKLLKYIIGVCKKVLGWYQKTEQEVQGLSGLKKAVGVTALAIALQYVWNKIGEFVNVGEDRFKELMAVIGKLGNLSELKATPEEMQRIEEAIKTFATFFKDVIESKVIGVIMDKVKAVGTHILGTAISGGVAAVWSVLTKLYGGAKFVIGALAAPLKDFNIAFAKSEKELAAAEAAKTTASEKTAAAEKEFFGAGAAPLGKRRA